MHHFSGVVGHITTLAVKDSGGNEVFGKTQLSYISSKLRNLRYLFLDLRTFIEPDLLLVEGLHFESLHLSFRMVIDEPNLRE